MAYTVNKLAKISGVSIRTLHFYDEIGLLKPAYYGENNYRYYEEEQLLLLQQILLYRELGFSLKEIQEIVTSPDFSKIEALISHKEVITRNIDRNQQLLKTIDKTIAHLRGKLKMKDEELYYGFDSERQKQYEEDLIRDGIVTQEFMDNYKEKINKWTEQDKENFLQEGKDINQDLISAIENNWSPTSDEVQAIIRRHHAWVGWNPTKEKYIGLTELYQTPKFKEFYNKLHPKLLDFIVEAMKFFAERELS
jgi:DNA-binding transcriptional MerR regulator